MIRCLGVIGVGLIGGSIARAARQRALCRQVIGIDRDQDNLSEALSLGVIDSAAASIEVFSECDFVVIAVPVGSTSAIFEALRPMWRETSVYTDVGSTKRNVIDVCRDAMGGLPANFVPGHPIAGAECSGVGAARADLFLGKRVILTPDSETGQRQLRAVSDFWKGLGAQVSAMSADHHDEILAATSHLPHVLAFTLVRLLGRRDEQAEIFQYAAGGFKDFTRIAGSDVEMWLDICLANADHILPLISKFGADLTELADLLRQRDRPRLHEFLTTARNARQRSVERLES